MYYCFRCNKDFIRKDSLMRHLKRKKFCNAEILDVDPNFIINHYEKYLILYNIAIYNKNNLYDKQTNNFICELCGKYFNHRCNYYTHKKKYCNVIKKEDDIKSELVIEYSEKVKNLEKKLESEMEYKILLEKKIKDMENNIPKQIDETITYEQSIQLNDYGKEDLSSIDFKTWAEIAKTGIKMVQNLFELIHIKIPSNRNIYLPNSKNKFAAIYQNNNWILFNKDYVINNQITKNLFLLRDIFEQYEDKFINLDLIRVNKLITYCGSDSDELKNIRNDVSLLLINNKELIKKNYTDNYGKKIKCF